MNISVKFVHRPLKLVRVIVGLALGTVAIARGDSVPTNQSPIVNAGADKSVSLPNPVTLMGTVTDDGLPTGSVVSVQWSMTEGPGVVTFSNAAMPRTYASFSTNGIYVLRLTADDGELSSFDETTVTVASYGNRAPNVTLVTVSPTIVVLPQESTLGATVTDDGIPGGPLVVTWSMKSGPAPVEFGSANATSTTVRFTVEGVYVFTVTASDGELQRSRDAQVFVNSPVAADRSPLSNPTLDGAGEAPDDWMAWGAESHAPDPDVYRSADNAWSFAGDGGLFQDLSVTGLNAGFVLGFGGHLLTPGSDPLRNGSKRGLIDLEFYSGTTVLASISTPSINQGSPRDAWLKVHGQAMLPSGATAARLRVYCADPDDGDGRFVADDLYLGYGATEVDSSEGIGNGISMAVVAGRPAVAYVRGRQLIYAINAEPDGSGAWSMSVVEAEGSWAYPALSVVNGLPVIAYRKEDAPRELKFAINGAENGLGLWSAQVVDGQLNAGELPSIAEADGRPAIAALRRWSTSQGKNVAYYQRLMFYINDAPDGSGEWMSQSIASGMRNSYSSTYESINRFAMTTIGGRPAIAHSQERAGVWFRINANEDGSGEWITTLVYSGTGLGPISLVEVAGKPALSWPLNYNKPGLFVMINSAADGSGSWSCSTVSATYVWTHALVDINGKPAVAFMRGVSSGYPTLHYMKNSAADASGAWSQYDLLLDGRSGGKCELVNLGGAPAILYVGRDNALMYLRGMAGSAPTNTIPHVTVSPDNLLGTQVYEGIPTNISLVVSNGHSSSIYFHVPFRESSTSDWERVVPLITWAGPRNGSIRPGETGVVSFWLRDEGYPVGYWTQGVICLIVGYKEDPANPEDPYIRYDLPIPISVEVRSVPVPTISVSPEHFSNVAVFAGAVANRELLIENSGTLPLQFSVAVCGGRPGVFTNETLIQRGGNARYTVFFGDMDADGDDDLFRREANGDVYWVENMDGYGYLWSTQKVLLPMARISAAKDMNGDGFTDLHVGRVWFENPGSSTSGWTMHEISSASLISYRSMADFDGDGDTDVLFGNSETKTLWWCENLGGGTSWSNHPLDISYQYTGGAIPADVDGDGDIDLVAHADDTVFWFENTDGSGPGVKHPLISPPGNTPFLVEDVNGDGSSDWLAGGGGTLWLSLNADGSGVAWSIYVVAQHAAYRPIAGMDVDGDGDLDLVQVSSTSSDTIWYENVKGDGTLWTTRILHGYQIQCDHDMDEDGKRDLVAWATDGVESNRLVWLRNEADASPPAWVEVQPDAGSVMTGGVQTVIVTFDATTLPPGFRGSMELLVTHDDPGADSITIPLSICVMWPDGSEDDWDGDGMSNADEEAAGTDPMDGHSRLSVEAVDIDGSDVIVTWRGGLEREYNLDFRTNLMHGHWVCVGSNLVSAAATNFFRFPALGPDSSGYYRLRLQR